jgi:hypothetical protein
MGKILKDEKFNDSRCPRSVIVVSKDTDIPTVRPVFNSRPTMDCKLLLTTDRSVG